MPEFNLRMQLDEDRKKRNQDFLKSIGSVSADEPKDAVVQLPITALIPFSGHLFTIEEEKVADLEESIEKQGIITPLLVRKNGDQYEIIAGHHRCEASKRIGLQTVPCIIKDVSNVEAELMMIDTNIQRGLAEMKPSVIGKALERRAELLKMQGKRTDLNESDAPYRTSEILAGENKMSLPTIHRYRRITHLTPELQAMVDDKTLSLQAGVELSYLDEQQQTACCSAMQDNYGGLTIEQAKTLRQNQNSDRFQEELQAVLNPQPPKMPKVAKREKKPYIKLPLEQVLPFLPDNVDRSDPNEIAVWILEFLVDHANERTSSILATDDPEYEIPDFGTDE